MQLKKSGLSIILAEQNLKFVMALSDYCHVMEKGEIQFSGSPADLKAHPEVLERYLAV